MVFRIEQDDLFAVAPLLACISPKTWCRWIAGRRRRFDKVAAMCNRTFHMSGTSGRSGGKRVS